MGAVQPEKRACTSSADNDCDGRPDNTIDSVCQCANGTSQVCQSHPGNDGKGPCHAGSQNCAIAADGSSSAWGTCTGSVGPAANDTCDQGNDANCNGSPNEVCACINTTTQPCVACGTQTCASGAWGTCAGQPTFAIGELRYPMPNSPGLGLPNPAEYDTSTAGTVVDKVTGLTWQQPISSSTFLQSAASTYCAGLGVGWRLPSLIELVTIVEYTRSPSVDAVAFPGTPSAPFVTSTSAGGPWFVDFQMGKPYLDTTGMGARVRCVR
jgi:hypothetical protein